MKKHFFFDLDQTLTPSTCPLSESMTKTMKKFLEKGADVIVVSGARREKMIEQLGAVSNEVALLAQNGNHAETASGQALWKREMSWVQKYKIFDLLYEAINLDKASTPEDMVQDRGCQISASLIGHSAPYEMKIAADPDRSNRKALIEFHQSKFDRLNNVGIQYAIGGTTCIDFYTHNKGMNVAAFIEHYGWNKDECVYLGDALFPGGNDETVKGVIETVQVDGPDQTEAFIKSATDLMRGDMGIDDEEDNEDDDDDDMR